MTKIPKTGFNETAISIGSGSWQRGEHYKYLVRELGILGYYAFAPELPTDEPSLTLEDVAAQQAVAEEQVGADRTVRFGHSSALNYVFRRAENIGGVILNAGGVDDKTYRFSTTEATLLPERRNSLEFERGIQWPDRGYLTTISGDTAARLLYSGCSAEDIAWALSLLKAKVRSPHESNIERLNTKLALGYIANVFDLAVDPLYQRAMPRLVFNIEPDWLPTGHSPNIQDPKSEAELIDEILKRPEPKHFVKSSGSMVTDETS